MSGEALDQRDGYGGNEEEFKNPGGRYALSLVCWYEAGSWIGLDDLSVAPSIQDCVGPNLGAFRRLPPGMCVYFEACHRDINATFKRRGAGGSGGKMGGKEGEGEFEPRIVPFDISLDGRFLPYELQLGLMTEHLGPDRAGDMLPMAAEAVAVLPPGWTARDAWEVLAGMAGRNHLGLAGCPLEGYVARQGWAIAKARLDAIR